MNPLGGAEQEPFVVCVLLQFGELAAPGWWSGERGVFRESRSGEVGFDEVSVASGEEERELNQSTCSALPYDALIFFFQKKKKKDLPIST